MKTSTLERNGISIGIKELLERLVAMIPWPARRLAMGDVTISVLDEKSRVAEDEFGWSRSTVNTGINECRSGIVCVNDLSERSKPKAEQKNPKLLEDIRRSSNPQPTLTRNYVQPCSMTAQSVYDALLRQGWTPAALPTIRTISSILNFMITGCEQWPKPRFKKNCGNGQHLRKRPKNKPMGRCRTRYYENQCGHKGHRTCW